MVGLKDNGDTVVLDDKFDAGVNSEKGSDRNGPVVRSLGWRVGVDDAANGIIVRLKDEVLVIAYLDLCVGLLVGNMLGLLFKLLC
jgi:hypothetical protein